MIGDKTLVMVKGPSLLGVNFRLVTKHFRFCASNQTFSPFLKGTNLCRVWAAITCRASSWAPRALFQAAVKFLSLVSTAGMAEFWMTECRAWDSYPIMRKNSNCEVIECGQWLWVNSA